MRVEVVAVDGPQLPNMAAAASQPVYLCGRHVGMGTLTQAEWACWVHGRLRPLTSKVRQPYCNGQRAAPPCALSTMLEQHQVR